MGNSVMVLGHAIGLVWTKELEASLLTFFIWYLNHCWWMLQVAIVVGGGNIFRGSSWAGSGGLDRSSADYIGYSFCLGFF